MASYRHLPKFSHLFLLDVIVTAIFKNLLKTVVVA